MTYRSDAPLLLALATALCCASGAALADGIELSGTASMGLVGGSDPAEPGRVRLLSDLDLQMRLSRTTDGGLTFGVEIDLDALDDRRDGRGTPIPGRR